MEIRWALEEFLSMSPLDCFEGQLQPIFRSLVNGRTELQDGELVEIRPYEEIHDLAVVSEIERFVDDLTKWTDEVEVVREEWLWDNEKLGLPRDLRTDLRSIFGPLCDSLDSLRHRCRRVIRYLPEPNGSEIADQISRTDLLRMLDLKSSSLNYRINEMGFPKPCRTEGKKQWFDSDAVDRWLKAQKEQ